MLNSAFDVLVKLINKKRKMLTNAPRTLVKESNIVIYHWNLCNHSFQNITYALFNTKVTFFVSLTSAPGH
jgi:hypothetical protein